MTPTRAVEKPTLNPAMNEGHDQTEEDHVNEIHDGCRQTGLQKATRPFSMARPPRIQENSQKDSKNELFENFMSKI